MKKMTYLKAREILDSRGWPTLEVDVGLEGGGFGRAAVPSGASTGAHEAYELRDGDPQRFLSKGVLKAQENIESVIKTKVLGSSFSQKTLDEKLIELDGSPQKKNLGANALLGISLAFAKAFAQSEGKSLYESLSQYSSRKEKALPVPLMNVINGGAHASNGLDVQEFMLVPHGFSSFKDSLRVGCEIFQNLKLLLKSRGLSTSVGDEGGFAPILKSNEEALQLLVQAVEKSGYNLGTQVSFALDVAATEFYKDGVYRWENSFLKATELVSLYQEWCLKYPIVSIEDGLSEDDWQGWAQATQTLGQKIQLVGDDLFVTHPDRLKRGIEERIANAILLKVNQIGTLTETLQTIQLAQSNKYKTIISHRSGETEDTFISDLAVGLSCEQIKTGSLSRGERTAKYNQLIRIEEERGKEAVYWGSRGILREGK